MSKLITPVKVEINFVHKTNHFKTFILKLLKGFKHFRNVQLKQFSKQFIMLVVC